jgi:hypothetical protein
MDIWLERHPAVAIIIQQSHPTLAAVKKELRTIRRERAQDALRERQQFLDDLRHAMRRETPYRDTRPREKRKYVRRHRSVADFTAKQTRLAERILHDLALYQERQPGETKP